jgi:uncharacterized damage-inducible protein DinB
MLSHADPAVPARQAMGFAMRPWPRAANLQTASSKEILMNYTDIFLADLEREAPISRRVLERVPDGKFDWKPAESSMPMGYLAIMVATMPEWLGMVIQMNELDIAPKDGPKFAPPPLKTSADLVKALDGALEKGRKALKGTNDEHLINTNWKLLSGGKVLQDAPRHIHIRDGVLSHWIHHRGQLMVYLRLLGAKVPSAYGPSGDEKPSA